MVMSNMNSLSQSECQLKSQDVLPANRNQDAGYYVKNEDQQHYVDQMGSVSSAQVHGAEGGEPFDAGEQSDQYAPS